MNITVLQNGFVTGDFLNPVAYAGEMNARVIEIVHPLFDNSFYQLLILKESRPYVLGIQDGKFILPPSLTDIACTLQCQFMALRKNSNIDTSLGQCGCYPESSNDCSNMIFKSDKFNMIVAEGLNINGLTPIPPYEQLVDMYNNLAKAKMSIENAKLENEAIYNNITDKLTDLQNSNTLINLNAESEARKNGDIDINKKLDAIVELIKAVNAKVDSKSIFKLTYYSDSEDDKQILATQYKRSGEAVNILALNPTKENKIFVNWLDLKSNKEFTNNELYYTDSDLELVPIWE